jgi:hypothetical protein
MPTGLLIEVKVIDKKVRGIYVRVPETCEERNACALSLIEQIAPGLQSGKAVSFEVMEIFFAVSENLKHMFPELGADVRRQFIRAMKERSDAKK